MRGIRRGRVRRGFAFVLFALAVVVGWIGTRPVDDAAAGWPTVVVAARDVPAGMPLVAQDLVTQRRPPAYLPPTAVRSVGEVVGRAPTTAMSRGEVLTAARIEGPAVLAGVDTGDRVVAVPLDGPSATLLRAGATVDVAAGTGQLVARSARVLAVHAETVPADGAAVAGSQSLTGTTSSSAYLVLAVRSGDVPAIASAAHGVTGPAGFTVAIVPTSAR